MVAYVLATLGVVGAAVIAWGAVRFVRYVRSGFDEAMRSIGMN